MRINKNDTIANQPVLIVRKLLKHIAGRQWPDDSIFKLITDVLQVNKNSAIEILTTLKEEGYLEKVELGRRQVWVTTIKGNSLMMASAAKPIKRETADKLFSDFLKRVEQVNQEDYYLYKISTVIIFGSYLGQEDRLGDIDIAVEIIPKEQDTKKHSSLTHQRANEAKQNGRNFNNMVEELFWAREEVKRYLRSRSRSISLHETTDPILKQVEYKVIYEE